MLAMHSVALSDGGGGSIDYTTLLDMKSVLVDGTQEQTTRVLYADTIDVDAVSSIIDKLYEISGETGLGTSTATLIGENDSMMASTNSNRFYLGETAKAQFTSMEEVNTKLGTLLADIDAIYDNKSTIIAAINEYNTKLKELKKECRINLLRDTAHAYNLAKHKDTDTKIDKLGWLSPEADTIFTFDKERDYVEAEPINLEHYRANDGEWNEHWRTKYTWRKYKIIKYWSGLMDITWFRDPGFEKVEQLFADVGEPLPYDPEKILPKEEA